MATFFAIETSFSLKYTINSTNNYFAISETKLDMNATACNLRNICALAIEVIAFRAYTHLMLIGSFQITDLVNISTFANY